MNTVRSPSSIIPWDIIFVRFTILIVLCVLAIYSCKSEEPKVSITGNAMGTTYTVKILDKDRDETLAEVLDGELARLEMVFSTYKENSEISKFNRDYNIDKLTVLSTEFLEVWDLADSVRRETKGAFSPTIGRIVEGWGFGAGGNTTPLPRESLAIINECKDSILFERREGGLIPRINPGSPDFCRSKLHRPKLDFSGIAKGYAVDRLMDVLRQSGMDTAMVEIGGDLCVRSSIHEPYVWKIGIRSLKTWGISRSLQLSDGCVATSGNAQQKLRRDGKDYTHIMDPGTGFPISTKLSSVTVVMEKGTRSGALSDAWATALFVRGEEFIDSLSEENGSDLLDRYGMKVYFTKE